jgi:hypothetical protein
MPSQGTLHMIYRRPTGLHSASTLRTKLPTHEPFLGKQHYHICYFLFIVFKMLLKCPLDWQYSFLFLLAMDEPPTLLVSSASSPGCMRQKKPQWTLFIELFLDLKLPGLLSFPFLWLFYMHDARGIWLYFKSGTGQNPFTTESWRGWIWWKHSLIHACIEISQWNPFVQLIYGNENCLIRKEVTSTSSFQKKKSSLNSF